MGKFNVGDKVKHLSGEKAQIIAIGCEQVMPKWDNDSGSGVWHKECEFELIPETPSWLPLEVGKEYRLRNGKRGCCISLSSMELSGRPALIEFFSEDGGWYPVHCTLEGKRLKNWDENPFDIIGPWIDKPVVDWDVMPKWAKSVAMRKDGKWKYSSGVLYADKGDEGFWCSPTPYYDFIPPEYCPQYDGPWEMSLCVKEED